MKSADDSWLDAIAMLKYSGQAVEPQKSYRNKGRVSFEVINQKVIFDTQLPIVTCYKDTSYIYMAMEAMWVLEGYSRLDYHPSIEVKHREFSDNGIILQGGYGPYWRNQKKYITNVLDFDRNSNQAVMTLWKRNPSASKSITPAISVQFLIREDSIHTLVSMRSLDLLNLPYDMFTFACLTAELASGLDNPPELGSTTISAASAYLYMEDLEVSMELHREEYDKWEIWKWTSIRHSLERVAETDKEPLAKAIILEASSGTKKKAKAE